jgi:hypothetical protein
MNNRSIADVAYAMLQISNLVAIVGQHGIIEYRSEEPFDKSAAIELLDPENPRAATDEELRMAKNLIQFKYEQLPAAQRTKAVKRFYEHLKKADTPMHARQKAIEQVTGKPLKTLFAEN